MQGDVVKLLGIDVQMERTGSREICNPAPTDTDEDWVVLVSKPLYEDLIEELFSQGYEIGGSDPQPAEVDDCVDLYGEFDSFKKGDINYIVTTSKEFYENFGRATALAKKLNLVKKEDRITLFQVFLYDNWDFEEAKDTWNTWEAHR